MKKTTINLFISKEVQEILDNGAYDINFIIDDTKEGTYTIDGGIYNLIPKDMRDDISPLFLADLEKLVDAYEDGVDLEFVAELLKYGYAYLEGNDNIIVFLNTIYRHSAIIDKIMEDYMSELFYNYVDLDLIYEAYREGRDCTDAITDAIVEGIEADICDFDSYAMFTIAHLENL